MSVLASCNLDLKVQNFQQYCSLIVRLQTTYTVDIPEVNAKSYFV